MSVLPGAHPGNNPGDPDLKMPPITILKSELVALEQKIREQEEIIRVQQDLLKRVVYMLTRDGLLPAKPETAESAGS